MIGVYDFCGHYEWTFEWLRQAGGHELVRAYWHDAIYADSQRHATEAIEGQGIEGMKQYWGHTLAGEGGDWHTTATPDAFRIDMHHCPSKGSLLTNGLEQYHDYCDHCMGWIGPLMRQAGFVIDHQHNHHGQCWWEFRRVDDNSPASAPGALSGPHDIRLTKDWQTKADALDSYSRATDPDDKEGP